MTDRLLHDPEEARDYGIIDAILPKHCEEGIFRADEGGDSATLFVYAMFRSPGAGVSRFAAKYK